MKRQRPHLYVLDGQTPLPCDDTMEWARWSQNDNRIDYTEITSDCRVSTIFTGLDARHFGDGPPLVFETMIFGGPESLDLSQWRYSSWTRPRSATRRRCARREPRSGRRCRDVLILARVVTGIALAFTGQWAVMNTLLLIGMNEFAVFLIGIAVFVVIAEYTKFLTGGR